MASPTHPDIDSYSALLKKSPLLGVLGILAFLNGFLFFAACMWIGGDAVGVLPSKDGFIVTSHGHHRPVTEPVWTFSLFYSSATLLLTPAIMFLVATRFVGSEWRSFNPLKKWAVCGFCLFWAVGWYWGVGGAFCRSLYDWRHLRDSAPATERTEAASSAQAIPPPSPLPLPPSPFPPPSSALPLSRSLPLLGVVADLADLSLDLPARESNLGETHVEIRRLVDRLVPVPLRLLHLVFQGVQPTGQLEAGAAGLDGELADVLLQLSERGRRPAAGEARRSPAAPGHKADRSPGAGRIARRGVRRCSAAACRTSCTAA